MPYTRRVATNYLQKLNLSTLCQIGQSWVLYRLAIIQRARQLGLTLAEIDTCFFGFREVTRVSERWRTLSQRKLLPHLYGSASSPQNLSNEITRGPASAQVQSAHSAPQQVNDAHRD